MYYLCLPTHPSLSSVPIICLLNHYPIHPSIHQGAQGPHVASALRHVADSFITWPVTRTESGPSSGPVLHLTTDACPPGEGQLPWPQDASDGYPTCLPISPSVAEDALAEWRQSWQPHNLIQPVSGGFQHLVTLPVLAPTLGPAHCRTELSGPTAELRVLRHGQARSRQSRASRQPPGSGQTGLSPTSQSPRAHFGSGNPGCCFHGTRLGKAAFFQPGKPSGRCCHS